jgi:hypothetical protein
VGCTIEEVFDRGCVPSAAARSKDAASVEFLGDPMKARRALATKSGRPIGRARVDPKVENAIRVSLASGKGILKTARECGIGSGTVQRVRAAMAVKV